tara:strand:- start:272 stop:1141 length:870 start_codon:yes stop_codon:yes gene_type:complete
VAAFLLVPASVDKEDIKMAKKESRFEFIDTDKELSGEADTPSEAKEESVEASAESPDDATEQAEEQESENQEVGDADKVEAGGKDFSTVEALADAYTNLQKLHGKQTNEIGDLRKAIDGLEESSQEPEKEASPVPEYDPYNTDSIAEYVQYIAKQTYQAQAETQKREVAEQKMDKAYESMVRQFAKDHSGLSKDELMEVAQFADNRGITFMEDAYTVKMTEENTRRAKEEGQIEVTKKLQSAASVPPSLSTAGSGKSTTEEDIDNIPVRRWGEIPKEERMKFLRNAPGL